jgi:hypothetical protein
MWLNRLSLWLNQSSKRRPARPQPARQCGRRLAVEQLEDRTVLSNFTAATVADLIADINAANQAAANQPGVSNTITLVPGHTFTLTAVDNSSGGGSTGLPVIAANDDLTILGNGDTIARGTAAGSPAFRLFDVEGALTLKNLTLANGQANGSSQFMVGFDGVLRVLDNGGLGGGIFNRGGLTLTNCTLTDNSSPEGGGGIFNAGGLTLTNCTLTRNSAFKGGGIENLAGVVVLANCTLNRNSACDGGGIENGGIDNGRFPNFNQASLTLTNCTLTDNTASGHGGGIENGGTFNEGMVTLTNCTLTRNSASSSGGGIFNDDLAQLTIANTIICGNHGPLGSDIFGPVTSLGYNLIGPGTGATGFVATDLFAWDPRLGPLQDNGGPTQTMALLPDSPAIRAGCIALAVDPFGSPLTTDQRGLPRVTGHPLGGIDIGAYQLQQVPPVVPDLWGSPQPSLNGHPHLLTQTHVAARRVS